MDSHAQLKVTLSELEVLAEQGDFISQKTVAFVYQNVLKDYSKAIKWYKAAALHNDPVSLFALGHIYSHGCGVTVDSVEAMSWFKKASDHGSREAETEIGLLYFDGFNGAAPDFEQAAKWFGTAAINRSITDKGDARAQFFLGELLFSGRIKVSDPIKKGLDFFNQSAEQGFSRALRTVGMLHIDKVIEDADPVKGLEYLEKAAEKEDPEALCYLASCYDAGIHFPKNSDRAKEFYQKAAKNGSLAALTILKTFDVQSKLNVLEKKLHRINVSEIIAKKIKDETATLLLRKAVLQKGSPVSNEFEIGLLHEAKQEYKEAQRQYTKVIAIKRDPIALFKLANLYLQGLGVAVDTEHAFALAMESAGLGCVDAMAAVGICYYQGVGVQKSYPDAFIYLKKAASENHAEAQFCLGRCFEFGEGIDKNLEQAKYWYKKARHQKHGRATEILNNWDTTYPPVSVQTAIQVKKKEKKKNHKPYVFNTAQPRKIKNSTTHVVKKEMDLEEQKEEIIKGGDPELHYVITQLEMGKDNKNKIDTSTLSVSGKSKIYDSLECQLAFQQAFLCLMDAGKPNLVNGLNALIERGAFSLMLPEVFPHLSDLKKLNWIKSQLNNISLESKDGQIDFNGVSAILIAVPLHDWLNKRKDYTELKNGFLRNSVLQKDMLRILKNLLPKSASLLQVPSTLDALREKTGVFKYLEEMLISLDAHIYFDERQKIKEAEHCALQMELERQERVRQEAERQLREKENERLAHEKVEAERRAREKAEMERATEAKMEAERLAREKEQTDRLNREIEEAKNLARKLEVAEVIKIIRQQEQARIHKERELNAQNRKPPLRSQTPRGNMGQQPPLLPTPAPYQIVHPQLVAHMAPFHPSVYYPSQPIPVASYVPVSPYPQTYLAAPAYSQYPLDNPVYFSQGGSVTQVGMYGRYSSGNEPRFIHELKNDLNGGAFVNNLPRQGGRL